MTTHLPLWVVWSKGQAVPPMNDDHMNGNMRTTMMKSMKTESHTPAEAGQHIPPQHAKSCSHKPKPAGLPRSHETPCPLHMNMATNEGQCMPEATGEMREPHTCCSSHRGNEGATHLLRQAKMPHPNARTMQPQAQTLRTNTYHHENENG
ncbi:hypothetical protein BS47DRAFT_1367463 [Hydnum rufescens UP504]|uniref:Uncharacterized protein n=1 Tax=Hydnum rufescens UP504 TaxID=1448309 RepID=A0A9P6DQ66_9AGAM|nr:hypothetical protein BS47DRAFT_1367463 [Hydnum rufescens UP504]